MSSKRDIAFLVTLMLVFTLVFFLGYSSYKTNTALLNVGIEAKAINWVVMVMSVAAIARIVFLLSRIESKERMELAEGN